MDEEDAEAERYYERRATRWFERVTLES